MHRYRYQYRYRCRYFVKILVLVVELPIPSTDTTHQYFTASNWPGDAICTATVSRGGQESTLFNTSNLIKHLKTHHSAKYTAFTDACGARPKQPILTDVLQKKKNAHAHTEREVERKTVPHRLSDCLCT